MGDRTFVRAGQSERVLDTRRAYQATMRADLVAGVEEITGREVVAFMSDDHIDPDMAIEAFVLKPEADGGGADRSRRVAGPVSVTARSRYGLKSEPPGLAPGDDWPATTTPASSRRVVPLHARASIEGGHP